MQGDTAERWRALCEQAAKEQDPQRLLELTTEINRLLEAKEQRLRQQQQPEKTAAA
jgi:hypothetical protein